MKTLTAAKLAVDKTNPIPRYLQVKQFLENKIRDGVYASGVQIPGERDLAVELQVSQMTVNKAILSLVDSGCLHRERGKGTFVRSDYRMVAPTPMSVAVVANLVTGQATEDFYLGSLFRAMQTAVANMPVTLSIVKATESMDELLTGDSVDGYLFVGLTERYVHIAQELRQAGKRVVVLGAAWDQLDVPYVDSDNRFGTYCAMEHLVNLGHRHIAGVFALTDTTNTQDRISAYRDFQSKKNLPVPAEFVVALDTNYPSFSTMHPKLRELLRLPTPPTAFFCGGYFLALEVIQAVREEGLRIPEDISVVGFDDPVSAAHLSPPLTTVQQPLYEMGSEAMRVLNDWFETKSEPRRAQILPTKLIIRESTACVKQPQLLAISHVTQAPANLMSSCDILGRT